MNTYDDYIAIDWDTLIEQADELSTIATDSYKRLIEVAIAQVPKKGSTGFVRYIDSEYGELEVFCDGASLGVFATVREAEQFLVSVFGELS